MKNTITEINSLLGELNQYSVLVSSAQSLWHSQHHQQTGFILKVSTQEPKKATRNLSEQSILATRSLMSTFSKISVKPQVHFPFKFVYSFIPNNYAHLLCVKDYATHCKDCSEQNGLGTSGAQSYSISHFKVHSRRTPYHLHIFKPNFLTFRSTAPSHLPVGVQ